MSLSTVLHSTRLTSLFLLSGLTLALIGCDQNSPSSQSSATGKANATGEMTQTSPEHDKNVDQSSANVDRANTNESSRFSAQGLTMGDITSATPHIEGAWSPPMAWPIIAIHAVLTPSGEVLTYGSDQSGNQGAFIYDVWNYQTNAHTTLPSKVATDIFCGGQLVSPETGNIFLAGGDSRGVNRNYVNAGVKDTNIFDYKARTMAPSGMPMNYERWYATLTTLPDGTFLAQGGSNYQKQASPYAEKYTPGQGWQTLTGISVFTGMNYPRSFIMPNGELLVYRGQNIHAVNTTGLGSNRVIGRLPYNERWELPAVMYQPGKVLAVLADGQAVTIDASTGTPTVTETEGVGTNRYWSSMAVLADGQVLLTGGGGLLNGAPNNAFNPALAASIWNPKTGKWTTGSAGKKSREYHSVNLLLPDATVLVGGGGAPGPVAQLNAEIYYPPYLFNKDGSKTLATRPVIQNAPDRLDLGKPYSFNMENNAAISRVTLVKTGSITHSMNMDQRFLEIPFTASGNAITLNTNHSSNTLTPGYYMLFAFNEAGVPSVAKIISIPVSKDITPPALSLNDAFDNFANTNKIGFNGNATVTNGALVLTPNVLWQAGSAFYRAPVTVNANSSLYSEFQFRMGSGGGADGMTFTLQGNNPFALGGNGGGLGYQGITKSIAIELDTHANNTDPKENSNSHISILVNGDVLKPLVTYHTPFKINDNKSHKMWVEYNSFEKKLSVYLSENPLATKPATPVLTANVDLSGIIGNAMYLGFTAGTGGLSDQHAIENWVWKVGSSPSVGSNTLLGNQRLFPNQYIESSNKKYRLIMQNDGNLVLYTGTKALWASNTMNSGAVDTIMQSDNNLVSYTARQKPVWASNTMNSGAVRTVVQDDGNIVMYRSDNKSVWTSNTAQTTNPPQASSDTFNSFTNADKLALNGQASVNSSMLTLTPNALGQLGSAFYKTPITLGANSSLSTSFQFNIGEGSGADGMTFTIQGNGLTAIGHGGGGLGYHTIGKSIAVELDTYANNTTPNENSKSHISILANGNVNNPLATYHVPFKINDNKGHRIWVDYNPTSKKLYVYLSENPLAAKPNAAILSAAIDLPSTVGNTAYVGFTAATGGLSDRHSIQNWTWNVTQ